MTRTVPHVLGLTYNGHRDTSTAQALRIPFTLPRDATRWRLSLAPGLQDAEETTLDTTGVTLLGAVLGRAGTSGVLTEALHAFGSQDISSGSWISDWVDVPLTAGDPLILSLGYTNPSGLPLAAGSMGVYKSATAQDYSRVGGSAWTRDHMVRGPMSPVIVYDTPGQPTVVAVVGDSNTAGRGCSLPYHEAFAHVAARRLGQVVVPLGYTGETMTDYDIAGSPKWRRVRDLCGGARWDGVLIQAGINDVNIGRASSALQTALPLVAARAREYLADEVWAATLPPATFDAAKESVRGAYNRWLQDAGGAPAGLDGVVDLASPVTDPTAPSRLLSAYNSGDNIHPNTAGHAAMSPALDDMVSGVAPEPAPTLPPGGAPAGATIFEEVPGGRRVLLRATTGEYLTAAPESSSPTPTQNLALWAPDDPAWSWRELPEAGGAVAPHYPTPAPPAPGEIEPRIITEEHVVTGNATGLGPADSNYRWTVEGMQTTRPAVLDGPLLRARRSTSAPQAVTLTITPPAGDPIVHTRQVVTCTMDGLAVRHPFVRAGQTARAQARFAAPIAGAYAILWEQLDAGQQLVPSRAARRTTTAVMGAGQWHTTTLDVPTPTDLGGVTTFAFRALIADPAGGIHVTQTIYITAHPAPAHTPALTPPPPDVDDRIAVPAGPLGADVRDFPLATDLGALAAFTGQIPATGAVVNAGAYGVPVVVLDDGEMVLEDIEPWADDQYKIAKDWAMPIADGNPRRGQLVRPRAGLPPWAVPSQGSDSTLCVYERSSTRLLEWWLARPDEGLAWRAAQGGSELLSLATGAWQAQGSGVSAAGLMQAPAALSRYAVTQAIRMLQHGRSFDHLCTHALLMALPRVRGGGPPRPSIYPATRSDGTGSASDPIMGARFRVRSDVDPVALHAAGGLTAFEAVIVRWLQIRGLIISDTTSGAPAIIARAYPWESIAPGAPDPWADVWPGRGWTDPLRGLDPAWFEALEPGHVGGEPTALVIPPAVEDLAPDPDPKPDPAVQTYASDTFSRTLASGWGAADVGGAWTTWGSGISVDGGAGIMSIPPSSGAGARLDELQLADQTVEVAVSVDRRPGVNVVVPVLMRRQASNDALHARCALRSTGEVVLQLAVAAAGTTSYLTAPLVTGVTIPATGAASFRVRAFAQSTSPTETSFGASVWAEGQAEPAEWQAQASTTTASVQGAGVTGTDVYLGADPAGPLVLSFTEWQVQGPVPAPPPAPEGSVAVVVDGATVILTDSLQA